MNAAPDLVLAGNLLVDDIVLADGTTLLGEPGGAVLHAALAASLWGCRVGILSVVGSDYPQAALDALVARGVDLAGVRLLGRPGGRAWLLHEPSARRVIHHLDGPSHADVSPAWADLPAAWRAARGIHLAPMPLERQLDLARGIAASAVPARPFVSLDPFEIVRDETAGRWREPLAHVDALFAGEDDLRLSVSPAGALGDLAGDRLRLLVLKQADRGGMLVDRHAADSQRWHARADRIVDGTGAGDAFAGGFLAGWLGTGDLARSLAQGVVSASLVLEDWGSRGLARATPESARRRLAEWFPDVTRGVLREAVAR
ncbi:MAG: carbohydrate kinase family protein [Planctomycetota bacterium]